MSCNKQDNVQSANHYRKTQFKKNKLVYEEININQD